VVSSTSKHDGEPSASFWDSLGDVVSTSEGKHPDEAHASLESQDVNALLDMSFSSLSRTSDTLFDTIDANKSPVSYSPVRSPDRTFIEAATDDD
jgi:hypothetical protein